MNQIVPADQTSTREIGIATGAGGSSIAPQNLGEVVRFAEVMSRADIALPKHLRGNAGACMAVSLQALEWKMNPFAVASKSYSVNGIIAYEAQLIAAVVNTRSGIKGRLRYAFHGAGNEMTCLVSGILDGEECTYETPAFGAIQPKNSPLWKTDPRQQLGYYAARAWARRHCPEVLLGVYDREEAEHFGPDTAKDITPAQPSVLGRLQARQEPSSAREGFDQSFVTRETENLASGQEIQIDEPSAPSSADAGSGESVSPPPATPEPVASAADPAGEPAGEATDEPDAAGSPVALSADDRERLRKFAARVVNVIGSDSQFLIQEAGRVRTEEAVPAGLATDKARSITKYASQACDDFTGKDALERSDAIEMIAGIVGCEPKELSLG